MVFSSSSSWIHCAFKRDFLVYTFVLRLVYGFWAVYLSISQTFFLVFCSMVDWLTVLTFRVYTQTVHGLNSRSDFEGIWHIFNLAQNERCLWLICGFSAAGYLLFCSTLATHFSTTPTHVAKLVKFCGPFATNECRHNNSNINTKLIGIH